MKAVARLLFVRTYMFLQNRSLTTKWPVCFILVMRVTVSVRHDAPTPTIGQRHIRNLIAVIRTSIATPYPYLTF